MAYYSHCLIINSGASFKRTSWNWHPALVFKVHTSYNHTTLAYIQKGDCLQLFYKVTHTTFLQIQPPQEQSICPTSMSCSCRRISGRLGESSWQAICMVNIRIDAKCLECIMYVTRAWVKPLNSEYGYLWTHKQPDKIPRRFANWHALWSQTGQRADRANSCGLFGLLGFIIYHELS